MPRPTGTPPPDTSRNEARVAERSGEPIVYLRRDEAGYTVGTQSVARLLADFPEGDFGDFAERVLTLLVAGAPYWKGLEVAFLTFSPREVRVQWTRIQGHRQVHERRLRPHASA